MAESVRVIANALRSDGHRVFDFTDPELRDDGLDKFCFNASSWSGKPLSEIDWIEFLHYDATKRAFASDKAGVDWADVVLMILPCGRSAHMEAGYAIGRGKLLYIIGELPLGEFDTMHLFAHRHFRVHQMYLLLDALNKARVYP